MVKGTINGVTFLSILYALIISPIELLFEGIFELANRLVGNVGLSILFLSLTVNLLILPLYNRADEIQAEARAVQEKMAPMLNHIKRTFKGDERFFMIQEYYRINNYKPVYSLKSSVSLFLQIPFFIAAYNLLSGVTALQGTSFGFISDLGREDALFMIGNLPVNVLPILMTLINIISGIIYTKGQPVKAKIQVFGLAAVFLVLLYRSPAGLVFYWLLNNVFSLVKNAVSKLIALRLKKKAVKQSLKFNKIKSTSILLSCAVLAVSTGILIPADVIIQNPAEMVNVFIPNPHNPLLYLLISAVTALGVFLLWIPVFYLFTKKTKRFISLVVPGIAVASVINYIVFNRNFGFLSGKLIYEYKMSYGIKEIIINLITDLAIVSLIAFITFKKEKITCILMTIVFITVFTLSISKVSAIGLFTSDYTSGNSNTADEVNIQLTTSGKNVIVIMLDKMNGSYVPYLFNERPDVAAQFDGFTYYPNTVSFGKYTNFGVPAVFGGYDYTPEKLNTRSDVLLVDKHNEALLTMPVIFSDNGWNVNVVDPSYANYQWKPDLSIYDKYDEINAYHMEGVFNYKEPVLTDSGNKMEKRLYRNCFCYGFMKVLPYVLQPFFYDNGEYFLLDSDNTVYLGNSTGKHSQKGVNEYHLQYHAALSALIDVTDIIQEEKNCLFIISNNSTHDMCLLHEPEYIPAPSVDNTDYDMTHQDRFTVNGVTMNMDNAFSYAAYECSMEAFITLGDWFDYLRENGLYDNTRIIIVSDHGFGMNQFEDLLLDDIGFDAEAVNPILMVKDFNGTGFNTSMEFMTNADTPALALDGIVQNPVNPFTNNPINQDGKSGNVLIYSSEEINVNTNNGTRFVDPNGFWLTVHDDIRNKNNWSLYPGEPV